MKNEQNEYLTKQINKNELKQAIFQIQNEKSPGIDGISVEFYKTFYETLENDLIQLYNNILFLEKKYYKQNETTCHNTYSRKRKLK